MADEPTLPPSDRHRAAQAIAAFVRASGLANGDAELGQVDRASTRRYYRVLFRESLLSGGVSGEVIVYDSAWVFVELEWCRAGQQQSEAKLFGSVADTILFLALAFVDGKREEADRIPGRPPSRKAEVETRSASPNVAPSKRPEVAITPDFFSADRAPEDRQV